MHFGHFKLGLKEIKDKFVVRVDPPGMASGRGEENTSKERWKKRSSLITELEKI